MVKIIIIVVDRHTLTAVIAQRYILYRIIISLRTIVQDPLGDIIADPVRVQIRPSRIPDQAAALDSQRCDILIIAVIFHRFTRSGTICRLDKEIQEQIVRIEIRKLLLRHIGIQIGEPVMKIHSLKTV